MITKGKDKAEDHLYTTVKVVRDEDLTEQIGRDIFFGLVNHDNVLRFRIEKQSPFSIFKVGQLREIFNLPNDAELKLFLEVEFGTDMKPVSPPERKKDDILLFFKLYGPVKAELR